jgi:hypothetical protein
MYRVLSKHRLGMMALLMAVTVATASFAQGRATPSPSGPAKVLTGKERLGEKWMDEQRVDNCKVPVGRRGTKPRSESCSNAPQYE